MIRSAVKVVSRGSPARASRARSIFVFRRDEYPIPVSSAGRIHDGRYCRESPQPRGAIIVALLWHEAETRLSAGDDVGSILRDSDGHS
jgi:hypothetical protein